MYKILLAIEFIMCALLTKNESQVTFAKETSTSIDYCMTHSNFMMQGND